MSATDSSASLRTAVHRVVRGAKAAEEALYLATAGVEYGMNIQHAALEIERHCSSMNVFAPDYSRVLRSFSGALLELAKSEMHISIVHDEGDMSGGRTERHYSEQGVALNKASSALLELAMAVDEVHCLLEVEQVLQMLKPAPMRNSS